VPRPAGQAAANLGIFVTPIPVSWSDSRVPSPRTPSRKYLVKGLRIGINRSQPEMEADVEAEGFDSRTSDP
jgi:hypothetical protein